MREETFGPASLLSGEALARIDVSNRNLDPRLLVSRLRLAIGGGGGGRERVGVGEGEIAGALLLVCGLGVASPGSKTRTALENQALWTDGEPFVLPRAFFLTVGVVDPLSKSKRRFILLRFPRGVKGESPEGDCFGRDEGVEEENVDEEEENKEARDEIVEELAGSDFECRANDRE